MTKRFFRVSCKRWSAMRYRPAPVATICLALAAGALPQVGWAVSSSVTLHGVRFIDSAPIATQPLNTDSEPLFTPDGYVVLRPLNSPGLSPFAVPVVAGGYSIDLPDGNYRLWQYVDSALLTPEQLAQVLWGSEGTALDITVADGAITWTGGATIPSGVVDFPFPDFGFVDIPPSIAQACNQSDSTNRVVVCGAGAAPPLGLACTDVYTAGQDWPGVNPTLHAGKRVFVYGDVAVSSYPAETAATVASLCNHGNLKSLPGNSINIEYSIVFANFSDGTVIGWDSDSSAQNGGSITLTGRAIGMQTGEFFNQGSIRAGNGKTFNLPDEASPWTFPMSESLGGNLTIEAVSSYQHGNLSAGQGSEIRFSDFWDAWNWEHAAGTAGWTLMLPSPSSAGGNTEIRGVSLTVGNSSTSGGKGGDITIVNNDDCGQNPQQDPGWCMNEIEGGLGGNLNLFVWNFTSGGPQVISALKGRSVYVEPNILDIGGGTTITADQDVVLFGGENHQVLIHDLAPDAIAAGGNIVVALGTGGSVNLTGNPSGIFSPGAGGQLEIHTDAPPQTDPGVTLADLTGGARVAQEPATIIRHVALNGSGVVTGNAGSTQPASLDVSNGGAASDTFDLTVQNAAGLTIAGLPPSVSVDALQTAGLSFQVVLPATPRTTQALVVTATSRADSSVAASFSIAVSAVDPTSPNNTDQCPNTPPGVPVDPATGCSIAQLCNLPWKNYGAYALYATNVIKGFVQRGEVTKAQGDALRQTVFRSTCAKTTTPH